MYSSFSLCLWLFSFFGRLPATTTKSLGQISRLRHAASCTSFEWFDDAWSVYELSLEVIWFLKIVWERTFQGLSFKPRVEVISCHGAENEQGTFNELLYYKSIIKHSLPRRGNSSSFTFRFGSRRGRLSGSWNRGCLRGIWIHTPFIL